ncbi:uncharacterized protein [Panulirus ornatus]|uniref:uncharacterized protein isoform X1 n=1 Tax=Panulirus ornatus TaxID=150431 RepID=UPI003A86A9A3
MILFLGPVSPPSILLSFVFLSYVLLLLLSVAGTVDAAYVAESSEFVTSKVQKSPGLPCGSRCDSFVPVASTGGRGAHHPRPMTSTLTPMEPTLTTEAPGTPNVSVFIPASSGDHHQERPKSTTGHLGNPDHNDGGVRSLHPDQPRKPRLRSGLLLSRPFIFSPEYSRSLIQSKYLEDPALPGASRGTSLTSSGQGSDEVSGLGSGTEALQSPVSGDSDGGGPVHQDDDSDDERPGPGGGRGGVVDDKTPAGPNGTMTRCDADGRERPRNSSSECGMVRVNLSEKERQSTERRTPVGGQRLKELSNPLKGRDVRKFRDKKTESKRKINRSLVPSAERTRNVASNDVRTSTNDQVELEVRLPVSENTGVRTSTSRPLSRGPSDLTIDYYVSVKKRGIETSEIARGKNMGGHSRNRTARNEKGSGVLTVSLSENEILTPKDKDSVKGEEGWEDVTKRNMKKKTEHQSGMRNLRETLPEVVTPSSPQAQASTSSPHLDFWELHISPFNPDQSFDILDQPSRDPSIIPPRPKTNLTDHPPPTNTRPEGEVVASRTPLLQPLKVSAASPRDTAGELRPTGNLSSSFELVRGLGEAAGEGKYDRGRSAGGKSMQARNPPDVHGNGNTAKSSHAGKQEPAGDANEGRTQDNEAQFAGRGVPVHRAHKKNKIERSGSRGVNPSKNNGTFDPRGSSEVVDREDVRNAPPIHHQMILPNEREEPRAGDLDSSRTRSSSGGGGGGGGGGGRQEHQQEEGPGLVRAAAGHRGHGPHPLLRGHLPAGGGGELPGHRDPPPEPQDENHHQRLPPQPGVLGPPAWGVLYALHPRRLPAEGFHLRPRHVPTYTLLPSNLADGPEWVSDGPTESSK